MAVLHFTLNSTMFRNKLPWKIKSFVLAFLCALSRIINIALIVHKSLIAQVMNINNITQFKIVLQTSQEAYEFE